MLLKNVGTCPLLKVPPPHASRCAHDPLVREVPLWDFGVLVKKSHGLKPQLGAFIRGGTLIRKWSFCARAVLFVR